MPEMTWMSKQDAVTSIDMCAYQLQELGKLLDAQSHSINTAPLITFILIHLNDVLQKASKLGRRITFKDDVGRHKDVTELIRVARNACCHISSPEHLIDGNKFTFNLIAGICPDAIVIDGRSFGCEYNDDAAIYYGATRVYLKRHIVRAINEVTMVFDPDGQFARRGAPPR
ncbi:hypothetical protein [Ancylobacter polymorphus]|uniref:Uncharacterized protein n=1 Tax=Ancylobacter polymorphus TaxID=223390 RepID=A0A9E6ZU84_9HYPH|nr:hypothetical protein [Ancylobacter polymorphus]UOK70157.1 hypothetical protein K9D25_15670 [Ancylobacter polymorphus]